MPKVYIIENEQPNAFATGRDPEHAAVAATTGLLHILDLAHHAVAAWVAIAAIMWVREEPAPQG